jgi:hypothetical protein
LLNLDEKSCRLIGHEMSAIGNIGADGVECMFHKEPKLCLAAFASVDAAGGKIPWWVLWKGKTERCEGRYRDDPPQQEHIRGGELVLTHQPNGWMSALVASDDLHWLRSRIQRGPILVLWDLSSARREQVVEERAQELGGSSASLGLE